MSDAVAPPPAAPAAIATVAAPLISTHGSRASVTARFHRRHWSLVALLLLGATLVYLLGNNLFPLIDRDEPRFAQASRQMLQSGDWTTPRFLDELRLKKPILIYWLQASSMSVLGETPFAARLPSSIAAVLTLALFAVALPPIVGHRRAFWTLFIFATALLPTYIAKVCMTDAVLHLFIAMAMVCLYRTWRGQATWLTLVLMGVAIGLSMLTKGPPVFLFIGMTMVALWLLNMTVERPTRMQAQLDDGTPLPAATVESAMPAVVVRLLVVLAIATAICVPWVISLEKRHPGAIVQMLSNEVVARGTRGQEGHSAPFGFYFVTFWGTYFPWCLFWPAAILHAWRRRHLPWVRFSLAAVVGPWLFLEIYRTKLPHYWLPSYPFMAILTADVLMRGVRARIVDFRDRPFLIAAGIYAGIIALLGIPLLIIPFWGERPILPGYIAAVAGALAFVAFAWGVFTLLQRRELLKAMVVLGVGFWTLLTFLLNVYVPSTQALTLTQRIGTELRGLQRERPGAVQMIEFKEPSLAFYEGGTIREQSDANFFANTPSGQWPRWTVMEESLFDVQAPRVKQQLRVVRTFKGTNLADGWEKRDVRVLILEKTMLPATLPAGAD